MGSRINKGKKHSTEERLQLFLEKANQLLECEYVKGGMSAQIKIIGDPDEPVSTNKPGEEQISSFLLIFRHFISDSEPVFIYRILNDAYKVTPNTDYRKAYSQIKELLKQTMACGPFKTTLNGEELTPYHALDLWINGYYFHSDKEKRAELEKFGMKPGGLAHIQLILSIPGIVHYILNTADIIRKGFNENVFRFNGS